MAGTRRKLPRMHPGRGRVWAARAVYDGVYWKYHVANPAYLLSKLDVSSAGILPVPE